MIRIIGVVQIVLQYTYFRSYFKMFGSVGKLVGTRTKSSELVFSGLLDSLLSLLPASVMFESSVATGISKKCKHFCSVKPNSNIYSLHTHT